MYYTMKKKTFILPDVEVADLFTLDLFTTEPP